MLYEALSSDIQETVDDAIQDLDSRTGNAHRTRKGISHRTMLTLAIATSIDAMAAGFTLNLLAINAWLACLIIAVVTAGFGLFGVYLGWRSGTWLEDKAEALGGAVLIAIGLKIMFFS